MVILTRMMTSQGVGFNTYKRLVAVLCISCCVGSLAETEWTLVSCCLPDSTCKRFRHALMREGDPESYSSTNNHPLLRYAALSDVLWVLAFVFVVVSLWDTVTLTFTVLCLSRLACLAIWRTMCTEHRDFSWFLHARTLVSAIEGSSFCNKNVATMNWFNKSIKSLSSCEC